MIPMFWPHIPKKDIMAELDDTLSTRWIGEGPKVARFEAEFSRWLGAPWCVAVNSGTSALEIAYDLLDIGIGDEVIAPVFTCTATNHPLLRRDARIIWADVDPYTMNVSVEDVLKKVTPKTKAIVVAHLSGNPVDIDALKVSGVPIVEDGAQSLGGSYSESIKIGNSGNLCAFSFQAIKHITTGDGGMLVCRNEEEYLKAKRVRWFGIDREAKMLANWHPKIGGRLTFQVTEPGYKFQMNDLAACLGLAQLPYMDVLVDKRRELAMEYDKGLRDVPGITLMNRHPGSSCWTYGVFCAHRDELIQALEKRGIESNLVQIRNDVYSVFGGRRELPVMDRLEEHYMYIPLHQELSLDCVRRIAKEIRYAMEKIESRVRETTVA